MLRGVGLLIVVEWVLELESDEEMNGLSVRWGRSV